MIAATTPAASGIQNTTIRPLISSGMRERRAREVQDTMWLTMMHGRRGADRAVQAAAALGWRAPSLRTVGVG